MGEKTTHQIISSQYIYKPKLEDFLSTTNKPGSFEVTRKLDKYHIQYKGEDAQQLKYVWLIFRAAFLPN